jgi:predicted DCC family thiol-disulfide oxidoreductase YuxK
MIDQTTTALQPATVIYDGKCGFCRTKIQDIQRLDSERQLQFMPRQNAETEQRFPQIKSLELNEGILLIDQHGQIYVAADAMYEIGRRLPKTRAISSIYRLPIIKQIIQLGYKFIAANRHRLGGSGSSCEL